jgi:TonB family protein
VDNYDRRDRDRLILSTVLALLFMGVVFAVFGVLDLFSIEVPEYSGPLYVSLGDTEEEAAELAPEPEEPADRPRPEAQAQTAPDRTAERTAEAATETTVSASESASRTGRTESSATEAAETRPDTPSRETAPPEEPPETAEDAPAGPGTFEQTGPDGRLGRVEERPLVVQPQEITPRTGGNEGTAPGADEASEPETGETGDGILGDLSAVDQALARADTGESGESGETDGAADGEGTGEAERSIGTPENPVTLEDLQARRKLLTRVEPDIPAELARGLPPTLNLQVSFELLPSGLITGLQITRSSGNTDIDSIVREAIRKWRFQAVPESAGSVRVWVQYTITVR